MGSERRGRAVHGRLEVNPSGEEPTDRPRQKNAGLWEPYDGRLSRTVLREREGEVPSRHSPGTSDGLDLDQLWADIEETSIYDPRYDHLVLMISPSQIAYGFRDSFGGFCSHTEAVRLLADDEASDLNPWVDGGCNTRRPRALEAAPGSNPGEIDIGWQRPFYQASPAISQYIVQWKSGSQSYDASRQATINALASLSYTISDLTTGNQYSVRIGASNLDAPTVFTDVDGRTRTAETTATAS